MSTTAIFKSGVGLQGQAHAATVRRRNPQQADMYETWAHDITAHHEAFLDKVTQAKNDPSLTALGVGKQVMSHAVTWRAELARQHQATVGALDKRIETERAAALRSAAITEDPILRHLRHREIRDAVRAVADTAARRVALERAVAAGNRDFVDAVAAAPPPFELFDGEVIAKSRERLAEVVSPEILALQELRDAHAAVLGVASAEMVAALAQHGLTLDAGWK